MIKASASPKRKKSKRVKIDETENDELNTRKEMVSNIFQSSHTRPNSIKLPRCRISRGLLIAIVFFILFGLLIVWFIFSSDNLEDEIDPKLKKTPQTTVKNETENSFDYENLNDKANLSNKLFVLFSTVFIVLAIISFVFIGALVHYFHKPKGAYRSNSRSQSIVSSIFSHHNQHNHLYYLDRDLSKEKELRREKKKTKRKEDESRKESNESNESQVKNEKIEQKVFTPPTIIVNETEID
ncbi:unnamed protein product [Brachionus calyciflorus]|uniref:Transmembrane protein n=1 Tax=Brachionus calyciflorus TaxID=104777 RepID=A0A813MEA9_9BILA|nr:unnamed protein product [Brachionus calyciflorus]